MFAPYCPTCDRRVLLGAADIVSFAWNGPRERAVVLRCSCGTLVDHDQPQPVAQRRVA
jgi:hypothetical protein